MHSLVKYGAVFRLSVKRGLQEPLRMGANAIISGTRLLFIFIIYAYVYRFTGGDSVGIPLAVVLASVMAYNILLMLNPRGVFTLISADIKSGAFEVSLLRPLSYLTATTVGRFGYQLTLAFATTAVALILYSLFSPGMPEISGTQALWGLVVVLLGIVLSGLLYILIALPAFWINDAEPLYYIIDKSILVLGGAYIPVALYPEWLKLVANYSPMGATMLGTRFFDTTFIQMAPTYVAAQLIWAVVLGLTVYAVYRLALRQVSVNGG